MKKIFTYRKWEIAIISVAVFAIDCIVGNMSFWKYGEASDIEEFYRNVNAFCAFKSIFDWIPYLIIFYMAFRTSKNTWKPEFGKWTKCIVFICLLSCIINTYDYFDNYNLRPDWFDWWMDFVLIGIFTILKIYAHAKESRKFKRMD